MPHGVPGGMVTAGFDRYIRANFTRGLPNVSYKHTEKDKRKKNTEKTRHRKRIMAGETSGTRVALMGQEDETQAVTVRASLAPSFPSFKIEMSSTDACYRHF